jgi:hypothetical protein
LEFEVTTQSVLDTKASYPINPGILPSDVRLFLNPEEDWIQSDDPLIVNKARELQCVEVR